MAYEKPFPKCGRSEGRRFYTEKSIGTLNKSFENSYRYRNNHSMEYQTLYRKDVYQCFNPFRIPVTFVQLDGYAPLDPSCIADFLVGTANPTRLKSTFIKDSHSLSETTVEILS
ncbi:MAG: hypothetical protein HUU09_03125 [Candidatus Jettenia caeni]|uniref:hypothetical protein n=1 Tax=Candidatus Jettenia sp. AMX1 TaxID=2293637 RepID=UPI00185B741B|nr:hypothetical protein [Candidatus Jettenia sp. AMX1]MDL1939991.1 hypothetical protein [Candidatus Jettenia sp. AMX1]NUN22441.1 hypothetical protein [Candidatus Jettenia caeni]